MADWVETLTGETRARLLALLRRAPRSIAELASATGLSDNAVRTHVVALGRDGIVGDVGTQKDTGGKPARIYGLTVQGEDLFPKAYAVVLGEVLEEIGRRDGPGHAMDVLTAVGERVASRVPSTGDLKARVEAAARALRSLGGDVDVMRDSDGWRIQGYACPLSSVASDHPEVCALAQALVARITGRPVTECCDRTARPRCGFKLSR